ncbi:MAG: ABC-F family ATP-binding cassette domain-containing protein [Deltaproteobacteria bacterium]|nr:ABC-F family ATP-binding cassette domain-containing protein [Deltaproteobacteria bacterium]
MSILLSVQNLKKTFGAKPLFEGLNFSIESGERIGLIGPNGAGKTSLLRILAGQSSPDTGELSVQRGLRIGFLEQVPQFNPGTTIESCLLEARSHGEDWEFLGRAQEYLSKLGLEDHQKLSEETPIANLSGGWKKRIALIRELLREPDLLLLDEPTNHLDIESILWLEDLLSHSNFATLTITHDRYFLQRVSDRILELDRQNPGGILSVKGNYADYLELKEQILANQQKQETVLRNTLRRETEWLRQGAKARTTKQQGRIKRAEVLKNTVEEISARNQTFTTQIDFQSSERHPKKLLEAKNISKTFGNHVLFKNLDLLLSPKTRLGLIGPNGCGKSSLLRVLCGEEVPDSGEIFHSEHLEIAYFEQNRESLDPETTLLRTLCPSGDQVEYRGNSVHIRGYLDRFLFRPEQMEMKVGKLSGGEQSRVLIARLMLRQANLLILDEPTNDLDLQTLNILQDCLLDFPGAILLVTHDRYFLSQVANKLLAFNPRKNGENIFFASLDQWEDWYEEEKKSLMQEKRDEKKNISKPEKSGSKKGKLTFKEQLELDGIEVKIQGLEAELEKVNRDLENPENVTNSSKLLELSQNISKTQEAMDDFYARWAELEKKRG